LQAVGQGTDDLVANILQFQQINDVAFDDRTMLQLFPRGFAIVQAAGEDA